MYVAGGKGRLLGSGYIDRVICGDAVEVLGGMPGSIVHLVVTSPPYNVGVRYDGYSDDLDLGEYLEFLGRVFGLVWGVLVDGGRVCINVPNITYRGRYEPLFSRVINLMEGLGYIMRGEIIWDKGHVHKRTAWGSWCSPSDPRLVYPYEYILVFSKGSMRLCGDGGSIDITGEEFKECSYAVWRVRPEVGIRWHPAAFPEELVYRLLKFYSYRGNVVLDPFCGSGTVGVVAARTGRRYICIDQSAKYCELAEQRILNTKGMF